MSDRYLTIKELTETVGEQLTPRMVRHYHAIGLLPPAQRSSGNYRLYSSTDVQRLRRIVALKQQGFQLSHIHQLLETETEVLPENQPIARLQQQYYSVMQQLTKLRRTAIALEGLLARDRSCQIVQAQAIAQLKLLETQEPENKRENIGEIKDFWNGLDAAVENHPEEFEESLQQLLPNLADRSEIEVDLLSKLVLACGDVSIVEFVSSGKFAIASARDNLKAGCQIIADIPAVVNALDRTRLAHLGCQIDSLIDDPHISSASEAEQKFWQEKPQQKHWQKLTKGCILVIGYAPSVLLAACRAIERGEIEPALVIGMPIGFSHAPAAKRRLMNSPIPYLTIEGSVGGGLLAAVALNALVESLIEKPDCHCYLLRE
jgi:precorrin-8X/cobalt-precorrin-8 methylmutase